MALICLSFVAFGQTETIRLKAEIKTGQLGYTGGGPISAYKNTSDKNPWKKTEYEISVIPEEWTDWYRESFWFQTYQWTYYNYKQGKMDSVRFAGLMKSWDFDTVTEKYTAKDIVCTSTLIYSKGENGSVEYYIDTDGDHDFSDEKLYYASPDLKYHQIDSAIAYAPWVKYELYLNGETVHDSIPLVVEKGKFENIGEYITHAMLMYAQSSSSSDTLIVNAGRPDFKNTTISHLNKIDPAAPTNTGEKREEGKRIKLNDGWYTYIGFNRANKEIILTKVDVTRDTVYTSVGFYAPDFNLKEKGTQEELRLNDFKGKYILLDFWGTWCKGCVLALPEMVKMKEDLKDSNFEIVSVACFSNMEHFNELKEKYGMNWLHTWQMTKEGIITDYAVDNYPSMFLIDPKGKIVGYNLSMEEIKGIVKNQN